MDEYKEIDSEKDRLQTKNNKNKMTSSDFEQFSDDSNDFDTKKLSFFLSQTDTALKSSDIVGIVKGYTNVSEYFMKYFIKYLDLEKELNEILDSLQELNFLDFLFFGLAFPDHPIIQINILRTIAVLFCCDVEHDLLNSINMEQIGMIIEIMCNPSLFTTPIGAAPNIYQQEKIVLNALNSIRNIIFTKPEFVENLGNEQLERIMNIVNCSSNSQDVIYETIDTVLSFLRVSPEVSPFPQHFAFYVSNFVVNDNPCYISILGCYYCIKLAPIDLKIEFANSVCGENREFFISCFGIENKNIRINNFKVMRKALRFASDELSYETMTQIPWDKITELLDDDDVNSEMVLSLRKICNYHSKEIENLHKAGCFNSLFDMFFNGKFDIKFRALNVLSVIIERLGKEKIIDLFENSDFLDTLYSMVDEENEDVMVCIVKFLVSMCEFSEEEINRPISETFINSEFMDITESFLDSDNEIARVYFERFYKIAHPEDNSDDDLFF